MSKSAVREQAESRFVSLSRDEQRSTIERNIASFQEHQEQQEKLLGEVGEIGGKIDLATLRLSDVKGHTDAMNASIAELIIGLDGTVTSIGNDIDGLQQTTGRERFIGMFSKKTATSMRETRIRGADIGQNLQNLLAKSDTIAAILQKQLGVIVSQKGTVSSSLQSVLQDRQRVLGEKKAVTEGLDGMVPKLSALTERIQNEADPAARAVLQTEFTSMNEAYNEQKMKEQELLSESQTLEDHVETYETYLNSLQAQEGTQRVLLTKIKTDTRHRATEYAALIDSMKTAAIQTNAHGINDVGVAVDKKGRTVMAGIAVGTERRMGEMLAAHEGSMAQSAFVKAERAKAQDEFDKVFGEIMRKHDAASYAEAG